MEKQRYLEEARWRVGEIHERIDNVFSKLAPQINGSEQLQKSQEQVDSLADALTKKMQDLHEVGDESWNESIKEFEQSWDELIDSLKSMVARFANKDSKNDDV